MAERKELADLLRKFVDHFGIKHPQMKWKRTLCDDDIEMVHHMGDTLFFGDANHIDPPDTESFDLIVALANATPELLELLEEPKVEERRRNFLDGR